MKTKLSKKIEKKLGITISEEHIHTDFEGWDYYIPARSLKRNHPLLLSHYRGSYFIVIPYKDMEAMELHRISVDQYISDSTWNYGYFWGGGSILNCYWQPLEERGINAVDKIKRYLTILKCRTARQSSGAIATQENCQSCGIKNCRMNSLNEGFWIDESEIDDRVNFFEYVKDVVWLNFGMKVSSFYSHDSTLTTLYPGFSRNTVNVFIPQWILVDLLNHQGKHDTKKLANELVFNLGIPDFKNGNKIVDIKPGQDISVIWEKECPNYLIGWSNSDSTTFNQEDLGIVDQVINVFKNIFNKI